MTTTGGAHHRATVARRRDHGAIEAFETPHAGAYHAIASDALYAVGWLARWGRGALSKCALSVWCALREVEAQQVGARATGRCRPHHGMPRCTLEVLAELTQRSESEVRAGLRALESAGLILWSPKRTLFFGAEAIPEAHGERERFRARLERTGRAHDRVPVARALLRSLARATTHSLFLGSSAALLRCAYLRGDSIHARGSLPASWARELFALGASTWRAALAELESRELVRREQYRSKEHRWAHGQIVDLEGYGDRASYGPHVGKKSSGGRGDRAGNSGGVISNNQPLDPEKTPAPEVLKNLPDRTGVSNSAPRIEPSPDHPSRNASSRRTLSDVSVLRPRWEAFCAQIETLSARSSDPIGAPSWLAFVALAQHALRITGEQGGDAEALFASNLHHRRFAHIAQCDEERAQALLRNGPTPTGSTCGAVPPPVAELLQELERSLRERLPDGPPAAQASEAPAPDAHASGRTPDLAHSDASAAGAGESLGDAELEESACCAAKNRCDAVDRPCGRTVGPAARTRPYARVGAGSACAGVSSSRGGCGHPSGSPESAEGSVAPGVRRVEAWPELAGRLCAAVGIAAYRSWFQRLGARRVGPAHWHVSGLDAFTRAWLEGHYGDALEALRRAGVVLQLE